MILQQHCCYVIVKLPLPPLPPCTGAGEYQDPRVLNHHTTHGQVNATWRQPHFLELSIINLVPPKT